MLHRRVRASAARPASVFLPSHCIPFHLWSSLHVVTADSPLGRGMLTGTITSTGDFDKKDFRAIAPRFQEEALAKVRVAARLLLGLLCCCRRAPWVPTGSIGQGQPCGWEG